MENTIKKMTLLLRTQHRVWLKYNKVRNTLFLSVLLFLTACTPAPPDNVNNVCNIFMQYPKWYWSAKDTEKKWGVPVNVQMAIMHQESKFDGEAKPPRDTILWIIPWFRPTSAYGYAQALDGTWDHYQQSTGNSGSRNEFSDASDFIGWYASQAHQRAGISPNNAYQLYLAFHEGVGGYTRGTYRNKSWLINVAKKVNARSNLYRQQLQSCQTRIPKCHWWSFCSG